MTTKLSLLVSVRCVCPALPCPGPPCLVVDYHAYQLSYLKAIQFPASGRYSPWGMLCFRWFIHPASLI